MTEIFASILEKVLDKSLFPKVLFSAICVIVVKLYGISDIWILALIFLSMLFILSVIPLLQEYHHKRKIFNREKRQRLLDLKTNETERSRIETAITEYYKKELSKEAKSCIYLLTQIGHTYGQKNTFVVKEQALLNLMFHHKQEFSFVLNSHSEIELITVQSYNSIYTFYINFDIVLDLIKHDEEILKQFIEEQTSK